MVRTLNPIPIHCPIQQSSIIYSPQESYAKRYLRHQRNTQRHPGTSSMNLNEITFVIPTHKTPIKTILSIPPECHTIIRKDDSQGKARNAGVALSTTEWIAFADDDITFTSTFLSYVIQLSSHTTIVGLQGYYPSPWLISRFMFFHKSIFDTIGPLKEVRHGEETEWCIRAQKAGFKLLGVPRESVHHHFHSKATNKHEFTNLLWLIRLHPHILTSIPKQIITKMLKSSNDDEYL